MHRPDRAFRQHSGGSLHGLDAVPEVLDATGTVDRIDVGVDHPVVVVFDLWRLGTRWMDRFRGDELVLIDESG